MEAGEPRGDASFETFSDDQSESYALVGDELNRGAFGAAEHSAITFAPGVVEECSKDSTRLVGPNVPKERHHAANQFATKFQRRMEPNYLAGNVRGEREGA